MTDKEIRRMKDGVISIFEKFNILDHAATIGSLRDDILRLIGSMQERPGLKFNVGDKVRNDKIAGLPICTIESIDDTTYYCDYTNFDIIVQDEWELVVEPKDCMYSKDNYTDEDRKVLCEDCKEKCAYAIAGVISTNAQVKKEPVSDDLEGEINRYLSTWSTSKDNGIVFCEKMAHHFAAWQKEQLMAKAVDGVVHRFDGCGVASVHYNDPNGIPMAYFIPSEGLSAGDKVKIITIKEE